MRSILILFCLHIGLPYGLCPLDIPTKTLQTHRFARYMPHFPPNILLDPFTRILWWGVQPKLLPVLLNKLYCTTYKQLYSQIARAEFSVADIKTTLYFPHVSLTSKFCTTTSRVILSAIKYYTGCFTTLGHNCRRWFSRSLWSKKFI